MNTEGHYNSFYTDYYYTFTKGILINACMWRIDGISSSPLIQIYKNTDTEWIIRVIRVYTSESSGNTASSIGLNTKITIYYI